MHLQRKIHTIHELYVHSLTYEDGIWLSVPSLLLHMVKSPGLEQTKKVGRLAFNREQSLMPVSSTDTTGVLLPLPSLISGLQITYQIKN